MFLDRKLRVWFSCLITKSTFLSVHSMAMIWPVVAMLLGYSIIALVGNQLITYSTLRHTHTHTHTYTHTFDVVVLGDFNYSIQLNT